MQLMGEAGHNAFFIDEGSSVVVEMESRDLAIDSLVLMSPS